jgi:AcrR family transcriptional regulator
MTGRTRPGGRTQRTRTAVHDATRALMSEKGGGLPTMAEVADRSGVHLATVYRRWRTIHDLVLDVAVDDLDETAPITVTGDLRFDLLAYARSLADGVAAPGGLGFLRLLIDSANDPEAEPERTQLLATRRLDRFQEILDAGHATAMTPFDLVDNLLAPIYLRALLLKPVDPQGPIPDRLVDNLIAIHEARNRQAADTGAPLPGPTVDP